MVRRSPAETCDPDPAFGVKPPPWNAGSFEDYHPGMQVTRAHPCGSQATPVLPIRSAAGEEPVSLAYDERSLTVRLS